MIKLFIILLMAVAPTFNVEATTSITLFNSDYSMLLNDVDNPYSVSDIQSMLIVNDAEDGDLTDSIYIVVDNYTGNESILGDYIIVFGVIDSLDLETTIAITVRNVDITAPVISIESYVSLSILQDADINLNLPDISAIDNIDGDLTDELIIDGVSEVDTSIIGEYVLIYSITDSSGNISTTNITINVVDSTFPVITGVDEIYKNSNYIMSTNDILDYFTATDDVDGDITSSIVIDVNQFVNHADEPGTYLMVMSATDSSGNKSTYTLTIKVIDNIIPLLVIDKYTWVVADNYCLSNIDFINTLKNIGDLANDTYVQNVTLDTYTDNFSTIGDADFRFTLLSAGGNEYLKQIDLTIIEGFTATVIEDPSTVTNIVNVIKTYWWIGIAAGVVIVGFTKK